MIKSVLTFVCFAAFLALASASELCDKPVVTDVSYTTTQLATSTKAVFISQFQIKCNDEFVDRANLHAVVDGEVLPVAVTGDNQEDSTYQVSWVREHDQVSAKTYTVQLYDSESFSAYSRAVRANEAVPAADFSVKVHHSGASKDGLFVPLEAVAVVAAIALAIFAQSKKSNL
ncbi:hypothetical protein CAOG_04577 [Capsaspora owczarzaki ATCC 30864]|uniref:Translocon-associated protein subunit delta n=1 Tax=Capsaspora owczarzaki (strain ATCC 30864) TaxID=595528 RepID=A0A0D2WQC8_CAPO3|nr:hypothetical protein CAOG_04577 [Capsaspora owczarzaki ATCC 30864]KJE93850.1 hypothetical protein CAOG_004577 [Capsaspora owczarzaki ATCC 30864]|eukprot:XP_004347324.1 hypothetical protein CAOG_04577 [Capsaspora owczarzaki ATCC 30864]